ncbi:hypothetical protein PS934_00118 [Pseudomonas fluorescens]|uniref:ferric reductase-like transmembrane domain-containing protein n=1 Tax=Pseudomonas fluorescens TaxID=294 RepID=UPI001242E9DB|nr:ferric reductase-like transmembrane domain-containing protein [Pseudomonas fluorescens]VVP74810.1 hypothetical protein PS934_00118 [Pseudomonas fluorescens]
MTRPSTPAILHGWKLLSVLAFGILVIASLCLLWQPQWVEGLRSAIRATARTSFALFLLAFLGSSLAFLVPGGATRLLLRERRFIGLAFAFSHMLHGVLILIYWKLYPETFGMGRTVAANVFGSVGYVFIFLLTLTSFPVAIQRLGTRTWQHVHSIGTWVVAVVFCLSYFKRILVSPWYALAFAVIVAAMVLKLVVNTRRPAHSPLGI